MAKTGHNNQNIKKHKRNRAMYLASFLFCMVLLSTCLLSGMYARFSMAASGEDGARVAAFAVEITAEGGGASIDLSSRFGEMNPGDTKTCIFTVENTGEVTVENEIGISTTGNLPLTFTLSGGGTEPSPLTSGVMVPTGKIDPGSEKTYTLTAAWDKEDNEARYAGEVDALKLNVSAVQAD